MEPQMDADERRSARAAMDRLTGKVIGCAITVSNTLGWGFLEKAQAGNPPDRQQLLNISVHRR